MGGPCRNQRPGGHPACNVEGGAAGYRRVERPLRHARCGPADLRVWLLAEDGWWGLVASKTGVR